MRRALLPLCLAAALLLQGCGGTATPQLADPGASRQGEGGGAVPATPSPSGPTTGPVDATPSPADAPRGTERVVNEGATSPVPVDELLGRIGAAMEEDIRHGAEQEGVPFEDVLRGLWWQNRFSDLVTDLAGAPGFASAAIMGEGAARYGELTFAEAAPPIDAAAYGLEDVRLVVVEGTGLSEAGMQELMGEAMDAARAAGLEFGLSAGSGLDDAPGTVHLALPAFATDAQLAALQEQLGPRVAVRREPPVVPCDEGVVEAARAAAGDTGAVVPNDGTEPDAAEADRVRGTYLGLSLAEAEAKAAEEGRRLRIGVLDGAGGPLTADLDPGRLTVTVCRDVVVDLDVDGEPR